VRSVFTDRKGRVWAGSAKGLSRWDPAAGSFVSSLRDSYVRHISEGVGVQWELRGRCGAWKLGSRLSFRRNPAP